MRNKIKAWGLEKRAINLKSQGMGDSEIARILSNECGREISRMSVSRFFDSERAAIGEALVKRQDLLERKAEQHLDVNEELFSLLQDIKQSIEESKLEGVSPESRAQLYNAATRNLELLSRRLGEISDPITAVQVNIKVDKS
jgi:hypothetical protein